MAKRNLFAELMEGVAEMRAHREGKLTLQTRKMLARRYDEVKSGKVQPVDGEEAFARLRNKSKKRRG
jgi:hypothetical protein